MSKSELEEEFAWQIKVAGLQEPYRQYKFHPTRKWPVDFCWLGQKVIVEVEGGIWSRAGAKKCPVCGQTEGGAHGRGAGIVRDIEKYNAATLLGFRVYRVTSTMIHDGSALALIENALKEHQTSNPG